MLVLHLPLTGNVHNQGLLDEEVEIQQNLVWSDAGKLGKCIQFNGNTNQILSFANVPKKTNNFTWACWVKQVNRTSTTYNSTKQYVLSNGRDCGAIGFNIFIHDGILTVHMGSGANDGSMTSTTDSRIQIQELSLNTWYHICCAVNDSNVMVYINGTLIKIFPLIEINFRSNRESYFTIGKMAYGHYYTTSYFPFDGYVQDVRVYDTCISPRQIKEISKGLVCHYPLGEVDGKIGGRNLLQHSVLVGEQLMCNSITTMNSVTLRQYEEEGYHIITPSEGNFNNGIGFQYNDFTSLNIKQGDTITFSCDIKGTSDSHKPHITIRFQANSSSGVWWGANAASSNPVYFTPSNDNWKRISVTYTIPSDEWTSKTMWLAIHGNFESDLYIKNLKLEKSSTATLWTPAPEDDASFYDNVIYDTSGYNNNGSVTDSTCPTWSSDTPRYKGSYMFNGNNQFLKFQNPITSSSTDFTISCWVKFDDTTGNSTICTMRTAVGNGIALFKIGNKIRFDDNTQSTFSDYTISANEWTHVVATRSSSCKNLYINGVLKQTINTVGDMKLISNVGTIGASSQSGDGISNYLNGQLSDFRIYATTLDNQTIEELYKVGASVDNNGNLMLAGEVIEE